MAGQEIDLGEVLPPSPTEVVPSPKEVVGTVRGIVRSALENNPFRVVGDFIANIGRKL